MMQAITSLTPTRKPRRPSARTIRQRLEAIGIGGLLNVTRHVDGTYTAAFDMPQMTWQRRAGFGRALAKQRAAEIAYLFGYQIIQHGTDYRRAAGQFASVTTPMVTFSLDVPITSLDISGLFAPPMSMKIIPFDRGVQAGIIDLGAWGIFLDTPKTMGIA